MQKEERPSRAMGGDFKGGGYAAVLIVSLFGDPETVGPLQTPPKFSDSTFRWGSPSRERRRGRWSRSGLERPPAEACPRARVHQGCICAWACQWVDAFISHWTSDGTERGEGGTS